jgi:histidine decarboxylase
MSSRQPAGASDAQAASDMHERFGSPSPWAFDPWDAITADTGMVTSEEDKALLADSSVVIPMSKAEDAGLPAVRSILGAYEATLQQRSALHLGYPYNLDYHNDDLARFMRYSINNLGDPFVPSNYGVHSRQFEVAVVDFFAKLWKAPEDDYWGYVTTCGTEGNLHGMLLARETFPDGVIYTSKETHYSIFKAANYYRMDIEVIPTLPVGEIDYDVLEKALVANKGRPAIMNVNIGTTVKGAVDNLDRILGTLKTAGYPREQYHVHCDGALFAMMMPFVEDAPELSFTSGHVDSIAVSGHKMLGCPMPCGVTLTLRTHVKKVEQRIDYLNSVDTTIMGSRNGHAALHMWHSLRTKGLEGIKSSVASCMDTAIYLRDELNRAGITAQLNDLSSTVVLERPKHEPFINRWQLACEEDIAHVVVMPNVTRGKVDVFVAELKECIEQHGRTAPKRDDSPLSLLSSEMWSATAQRAAAALRSATA